MIKSKNGNAMCTEAPFMGKKALLTNIPIKQPDVTPNNCTVCCGYEMIKEGNILTCQKCNYKLVRND